MFDVLGLVRKRLTLYRSPRKNHDVFSKRVFRPAGRPVVPTCERCLPTLTEQDPETSKKEIITAKTIWPSSVWDTPYNLL